MNKTQLKEIERIGEILGRFFRTIDSLYSELIQGVYSAPTTTEKENLRRNFYARFGNLSLAEYKSYQHASALLYSMHDMLGDSRFSATTAVASTLMHLQKQAQQELSVVDCAPGDSLENYKETKPLRDVIQAVDNLLGQIPLDRKE